jgi:tRNA 2-thiouridine synthesizing protein A
MAETVTPDQTLDCSGMLCPMPIVKARIAMKKLQPGQVLQVFATDPGSMPDFQAFAQETGYTLLSSEEGEGLYTFLLRHP